MPTTISSGNERRGRDGTVIIILVVILALSLLGAAVNPTAPSADENDFAAFIAAL